MAEPPANRGDANFAPVRPDDPQIKPAGGMAAGRKVEDANFAAPKGHGHVSYKEPTKMGQYIEIGDKVLDKASGIPKALWKACAGAILLSGEEVGFLVSAQGSSGVAVAHKDGKWSSPVAVSIGAVGGGVSFGYATKDVVVLLNHFAMDRLLKGDGQMTIGLDAGFAVGKVGKVAGGELAISSEGGLGSSLVFTYQTGAIINVEAVFGCETTAVGEVNKEFYGSDKASDILTGADAVKVPESPALSAFIEKLDKMAE